ncbi:MAG TPA: hypothetical protein VL948_05155 [Verrucomicrobiae bacterium]|jgi:hypothetical protein|nr:hypothetical protein [Verrucomicrobiae bacterium]
MKPMFKVGVVVLGYVAAFVVASAVTAIRIALTSGPDAQASSGMYAFGDAFLWLNVFGICALLPTGAALYFLRSYRRVWSAVATAALTVGVTGLAAVILYALRQAEASMLAPFTMLSPLRLLVAPLLALVFLVCALVAPRGFPRSALLSAALMEMVATGYIGLVWFVPVFLGRS